MTTGIWARAALAAAAIWAAAPAAAQGSGAAHWDGTLFYTARETVTDDAGDFFDDDRFTGSLGFTRSDAGGGFRLQADLGVRNEFFGGDYPPALHVAALSFRGTGARVWGVGLRGGGVAGRGLSGEVSAAAELRGAAWTLRGLGGVQGLTEDWPKDEAGRGDLFLTSEASVYPADWAVLRGGATLDTRGAPVVHVAAEVRPRGGPFGAFADWAVATGDYRGEDFYDQVRFGISLSFAFDSLRARDRAQNQRLLWRPFAAQ